MNLAQSGNENAAYLCAVVTTLRRLYRPQLEADAVFATALDALQRNEQRSLPQVAAVTRQPTMSGNPA